MSNKKEFLSNQSRRQFIRGFGLMVGGGVASTLLTAHSISFAMAYSPQANSEAQTGAIFDSSQLRLLKQICALIIPTTDTPGAADVDVHGFIDHQLYHCHNQQQQQQVVQLLQLLQQSSQSRYQNRFKLLTIDQQVQLLTDMEQGQEEFEQQHRKDFKFLKTLICFGYYTSEVGASEELRFLPVPGGFKGSIPYQLNDRSWS